MNRCKFRAWDKINKEWYFRDIRIDREGCPFDSAGNSLLGEVEIVFYTGLKDGNGKEIYEGDICNIGEKGLGKPAEIIFENGCFCANVPWIKGTNYSAPELKSYCNKVFQNCIEVIGNIYKNPELLK